jgi:hypothetical protein
VWREASQRKDFVFEVLDVGQPEGRAIVARHAIKTVPAGVVDNVLRHVGIPTLAQALEFVAAAPDRSARQAEYVGMTLGVTSRWAIAAAALYLALAGAGLVFGDGIAGVPPWRAATVHLFGLGFVTFAGVARWRARLRGTGRVRSSPLASAHMGRPWLTHGCCQR